VDRVEQHLIVEGFVSTSTAPAFITHSLGTSACPVTKTIGRSCPAAISIRWRSIPLGRHPDVEQDAAGQAALGPLEELGCGLEGFARQADRGEEPPDGPADGTSSSATNTVSVRDLVSARVAVNQVG
jgi:hypothetical protein